MTIPRKKILYNVRIIYISLRLEKKYPTKRSEKP